MQSRQIKRREFITLLGGAVAWPLAARAQVSSKRPLVAILFGTTPEASSRLKGGFLQGMREFGYVEGRNFELAERYADGRLDRFAPMAEELVRLKPEVIVTASVGANVAVKQATAAIPIVSAALVDPIGEGWVASHARPGGQMTGMLWNVDTLPGKQLSLAIEVVPGATRIGMLVNRGTSAAQRDAEAAAAASRVKLVPIEADKPEHLEPAVEALTRERVDLVLIIGEPLFFSERKRIVALMAAARLPALYAWREIVEAGGLMSYGIDLPESFRRSAFFVDRILKGTKPGDLPVELPTKFELVINLSTAKALGLTITREFQLLADEVIE